jgi:hypothetical protein
VALALGAASAGAREAAVWKQGAPLPVPRSEVAAATVGKELVIAGGFLADGRSSRRVDAYSPVRNRWRRLPDLPVAVNHAMAASDGRRLYVAGGYGAPTRRSSSTEAAGGGCQTCRSLARPPAPRSSVTPSTWSAASPGAAWLRERLPWISSPGAGRASRDRSRGSISA